VISYLLPTHNRPDRLADTLKMLGELPDGPGGGHSDGEIIVVDNGSDPPATVSPHLENGWPVILVRLEENHGTAARNMGAEHAQGEWIVMLDDDSYPLDGGHVVVLNAAPDDVAAIGASIILPDGQRESGGLPEVFIGCGVAIRRKVFLELGGYDSSFGYYAEEYDFCAKAIRAGWRIIHDFRFRVHHEKVKIGRNMNAILHHLVRNNGWVWQRYAPPDLQESMIALTIERYARIAIKENAAEGYAHGVSELLQTLSQQPLRPLNREQFDRLIGLTHVRNEFTSEDFISPGTTVALVASGKHDWVVRQAVEELGAVIVNHPDDAEVVVVGSLSPGPMLDAFDQWEGRHPRIICPWWVSGNRAASEGLVVPSP